MNNLLAFETSSPILSLALQASNQPVRTVEIPGFLQHAENLLPSVHHLLREAKLKIQDVDAFLIGRGPGSFTGLRIGFASLKGFLATQKRPCYAGLSMDMIAENTQATEGSTLAVCLDARREKIYLRRYKRIKKRWTPLHKPLIADFSQLLSYLPDSTLITGDILIRYREPLREAAKTRSWIFLEEKTWYPRAETLISWLKTKDSKLVPLKKAADFLPLYLRLSEAEERRKRL